MVKKIEKMLKMQDELNKKTIGNDWKNRDDIRWNLAIVIETAELIDSLNWKWWKKGKYDIVNAKIEIVDIWHFILSFCLKNKSYGELEEDIEFVFSHNKSKFDKIDASLNLINIASKKRISICELTNAFAQLMSSFNMSFNELYGLYIGKNVLNNFRRKNGYKDGTYIKEWVIEDKEPMEDNKYMFEVVKNNLDKIDEEYIYKQLEHIYKKVRSKQNG